MRGGAISEFKAFNDDSLQGLQDKDMELMETDNTIMTTHDTDVLDLQTQIDAIGTVLEVTSRTGNVVLVPPFAVITAFASCEDDELVVGGGFEYAHLDDIHNPSGNIVSSKAISDTIWAITFSSTMEGDNELSAIARCLKIVS